MIYTKEQREELRRMEESVRILNEFEKEDQCECFIPVKPVRPYRYSYRQLGPVSCGLFGYTDTRRLRKLFSEEELGLLVSDRKKGKLRMNSRLEELCYARLVAEERASKKKVAKCIISDLDKVDSYKPLPKVKIPRSSDVLAHHKSLEE